MSSAMPKAGLKKIKSALNRKTLAPYSRLLGAVGVLLIIGAVAAIVGLRHPATNQSPIAYHLHLKNQTYQLEAATTEAQREHGLSGRAAMEPDHGMLFWYPSQDKQCYWMKDMHFSLDIIWVSSNKRITAIERNLSPATYPRAYCAPAQYVIELNAGVADWNRLTTGQKLDF